MTETNSCIVCSSKMRKMFDYKNFDYLKCSNCRHVTTYPYPTQSQIEEHYREGFKKGNYNVVREHSSVYEQAMGKMVKMIDDFLRERGRSIKSSLFLDIGCFTGDFLAQVSKMGADAYGVELQEEAVKIAESKLPGRIFNENVMSKNVSVGDRKFDIITLLGVVEHVTSPYQLIKRAGELLKPDGVLVVQTPNSSSMISKTLGKYWPPYSPVEHIHLFSTKSLINILNKSGFHNVECKQHWKRLSISYVYNMFETFGPEFYKMFGIFYKAMPKFIRNSRLPFYIGETMCFAYRR